MDRDVTKDDIDRINQTVGKINNLMIANPNQQYTFEEIRYKYPTNREGAYIVQYTENYQEHQDRLRYELLASQERHRTEYKAPYNPYSTLVNNGDITPRTPRTPRMTYVDNTEVGDEPLTPRTPRMTFVDNTEEDEYKPRTNLCDIFGNCVKKFFSGKKSKKSKKIKKVKSKKGKSNTKTVCRKNNTSYRTSSK